MAQKSELSKTDLRKFVREYLLTNESDYMRNVVDSILRFKKYDSYPILIIGKTGVGKEWVARLLAADEEDILKCKKKGKLELPEKRLTTVLCNLSEGDILQSELFGHTIGSFTGAIRDRNGILGSNYKFVFFDEIGKSPQRFQFSLYRYIEFGELKKFGSDKIKKAGSHKKLIFAMHPEELNKETLRFDFLSRIRQSLILMPDLKSRLIDIPLIAHSILNDYLDEKRLTNAITHIDSLTLWFILAYDWPYNLREIRQFLQRAVIENKDGYITLQNSLKYFYPKNYEILHDVLKNSRINGKFVEYFLGIQIDHFRQRMREFENEDDTSTNQFGAKLFPPTELKYIRWDLYDLARNEMCNFLNDFCNYIGYRPMYFPIKETRDRLNQVLELQGEGQKVTQNAKYRPNLDYKKLKKINKSGLESILLYNSLKPGESIRDLAKKLEIAESTMRYRLDKLGLRPPKHRRLKKSKK